MSLFYDEFGVPFILLHEQEKKKRLKGIEAQKSNILASISVMETLKTSFGPKGMDKIICSPDGDVTITNDGATILSKMEITQACAKLLVELSTSQDDEIGDGTTGVVILAGTLLQKALRLLEKGLHPIQIANGFERAAAIAIKRVEENSVKKTFSGSDTEFLISAAMTALGSKVVNSCQRHFADIAVRAVYSVADLDRQDVNFDLIKIEGKPGGTLTDSHIVKGIVLDKDFSHPQMKKHVSDAKIAILTCPFEPPKPKTKHKLDISTTADYKLLQQAEQQYFKSMLDHVINSGANFVVCQWGFDDEANHLLYLNDLPAVRWVGGVELELIAIATAGKIVSRFEDLTPEKLGKAGLVREITTGTEKDQMVIIEDCANTKSVTVIIRGGNQMIVDEAKRCFHDAICCVRNLIKNPSIVAGGGASEVSASIAVQEAAENVSTIERYAMLMFADALLSIPEALADNSGMNLVTAVSELKSKQLETKNPFLGIDCMGASHADMIELGITESLISKQNQISLATQVVRMILKIDDVILSEDLQDI